jgi:hypothetical protein
MVAEDLRNLEFLAVNSKEIIEKQVDSYRQKHSYAGTIIGATALFIPFFIGSFDGTSQFIQFISIIPTGFYSGKKVNILSYIPVSLTD